MGGVGNPDEAAAALALEALKALAMAAIATAATALPEPWGTGIKGGGTGKWVKAWLEEVAEDGVRLSDECVTRGLFGAVWRPPLWVVVTAAGLVERSTGVVVNLNWRPGPSRPALFGDLLWNALFRPPASTKCLN